VREVRTKVVSKSHPDQPNVVVVKGKDLVVHCPCESFKFRQECSHFEVIDQACGWDSMKSAVKQQKPGECPLCGAVTEQVMRGARG